jgi:acyl-[acyl-carrier-protein]-phospholipid O-acyltransferase/long-chain-fatty-acid--[acyl-carrier-protein] ligase
LATFPAFAKETLGESNTVVIQGILACSGFGIIIGSLLAGQSSKHHIETSKRASYRWVRWASLAHSFSCHN